MALIAGTLSQKYSQYTADQYTGDGSTKIFNLSRKPASPAGLIVTIDGVKQHTNTFSLSAQQIVFSEAPPSGSAIEIVAIANQGLAYEPSDSSITESKLAPAAVTETRISNNAVTESKLGPGSVSSRALDIGSGDGTGSTKLPVGTTADRPTGSGGELRFNSEIGLPEYHDGGGWNSFSKATHTYDFSKKATLVTGITDSGTTTVRTYNLSSYFTVPSDTVGVVIKVRYVHSGSTNHGYFNFNAYQSGYSSNYNKYESSHYDWYYNTTNENLIVPWTGTGSTTLYIACTSSYNSSGSNTYSIYVEGIIRGVNT